MFSTLHIPHFPLAVLLRDDPGAAQLPAALVSSGGKNPLVLAVNALAARHHLAPGVTPTRALARCPRLRIFTPDPDLERRHHAALQQFAASLSPDFESTAPGTVTLDLLTIPHAQSAPRDWIDHTLHRAIPLRLPLHLALAPTPDLAHLGALYPETVSRLSFDPEPGTSVQYSVSSIQTLKALPLSFLNTEYSALITSPKNGSPLPDPELLHLWGLQTLGDLADLPRQGLAERLGPGAARLHDILHGKHRRLLTLHRPPQDFHLTHDLDHPLETLEPLLFLLRRSLDTLCARLAAVQRAASALTIALTFDDDAVHQRLITLPEPSIAPPVLLRPLHTWLDTVRAAAPVTGYALHLTPTLPGESQHHLFEQSLRDPNKFADTLARLDALLGPGRLGTPVPLDTHRPDSFRMEGIEHLKAEGQRSESDTSQDARRATCDLPACDDGKRLPSSTALPLKRYRPPLEIHLACEPRGRHQYPLAILTGPHRGPVTAAHGPFPLSGHWWNPEETWQRVEWDIQLDDAPLLRLAHLPPHRWLLEGSYQ